MRPVAIIIAILAPLALAQNKSWSGDDVPDPMVDPSGCGVSSPGQVCDPDHLLGEVASSEKVLNTLTRLSSSSSQAVAPRGLNGLTHCNDSDAKIEYWTVIVDSIKTLNPQAVEPEDTDMITFAEKVRAHAFKSMNGDACQNYVLISVAKEPRLVYLLKGKHVPDDLSVNPDAYFDGETDANLKAGEINQAVMRIAENLNGNVKKLPARAKSNPNDVQTGGLVANYDYEGGHKFTWPWLLLIAIVASVLLLLLLLAIYITWAAYYRHKKTGKWRIIPIRVRHLSKTAPDDHVYPESIASQTVRRTYTNDRDTAMYSTLGGYKNGDLPAYSPTSTARSPVSDEGQQVTPRDLDASSLESSSAAYASPENSSPDHGPKEANITIRH